MNAILTLIALVVALFFAPSFASAQALSRQQKVELVKQSFGHPATALRRDAPLEYVCGEIAWLQEMNEAYWVGTGYNGTDRSDAPLWNAAGINELAALDIMVRHKTAVKTRLASVFEKSPDERNKLGVCAYPTKWGITNQLVFESSSAVFNAYHEIHFLAGGDTRDTSDIDVMRWKRDQDMQKRWTTLNLLKAVTSSAGQVNINRRIDAVRKEAKEYNVRLY